MTDVPREDRSEDQPVDVSGEEPVGDETAYDERPSRVVEPTGHPAVDEVLRSLDELDGRSVDEHVAIFEQAHDRLRQALSGTTDDDAAPPTAP